MTGAVPRSVSLLAFSLALLAGTGLAAQPCVILPPEHADPGLYAVVYGWPEPDVRVLVEEYAYVHDWRRHEDAVGAGFHYGDEVYGQILRPEGVFDVPKAAAWKRAYAKNRRPDYLKRLAPKLRKKTIEREFIAAALSSCVRPGLWAKIVLADDCRFTFAAGYRVDSRSQTAVHPARLSVTGAKCDGFPSGPLNPAGASVQCVRSGSSGVSILLETAAGEVIRQDVKPLPVAPISAEPVLEEQTSAPATEVITLYRSRDFRSIELGRGCPSCRLYAADLRPSAAGATIVDIGVVASDSRGHWLRCPAGLRCGVPEFTPPGERTASGCADQTACRVWRLSDDEQEASDTLQITYRIRQSRCRNCPDGLDYAAARERWEKEKASAAVCATFPNPPVQVLQP